MKSNDCAPSRPSHSPRNVRNVIPRRENRHMSSSLPTSRAELPPYTVGAAVSVWVPKGHAPHAEGVVVSVGSIPAFGTSAERWYHLEDGRTYAHADLAPAPTPGHSPA